MRLRPSAGVVLPWQPAPSQDAANTFVRIDASSAEHAPEPGVWLEGVPVGFGDGPMGLEDWLFVSGLEQPAVKEARKAKAKATKDGVGARMVAEKDALDEFVANAWYFL